VSLLEAIVLGITQGLTEFLPISSTGHLRIVPALLGWDDPGAAFTAVIQLGTMAAVVLYFWRDLIRIGHAWLRSVRERSFLRADIDARLGWYILIGTIPIGIFGLAFKDQIETGARDLYLIGSALIVLGLVLLAAEKVGTRERDLEHVRTKDGVVIGLAQALALIPGVSRSGSTITAGLFMGLDRPAAARFSFLLSIPAVVLSGLFEFAGILTGSEHTDTSLGALAVATLFAFVSGYAAIAFLLRYLERHSTIVFVVYRVALGTLVIALAAAGAIK
jgi:undecaprenyl-diphosphatase